LDDRKTSRHGFAGFQSVKLKRYLIVNADDFGLNQGVNLGIIEAHEHGIVTSASLMVRWHAAREAAAYARSHRSLSLGLHVDLGEWVYVNEEWKPVYEVIPLHDHAAVRRELARQIEEFVRLVGREPSHLNSHQHAHRSEEISALFIDAARELGIPLRHFSQDITYNGSFYGQTTKGSAYHVAISVENLVQILEGLQPGVTELACHPGFTDGYEMAYAEERALEVQTLCDVRVRAAIEANDIELCSFTGFTRKT
jgi:predicted glycoside hydrolase/deacetylase ChbG (UPF0249 family)